jgi:glycosyltransferase involved in cell wall biosynthesis
MRKLERFERKAFAWADAATAVSEAEAETIRSFAPDTQVSVIENGVDLEYFVPRPLLSESTKLVFVGSLDWRPNQDAIKYFVGEILPILESMKLRIELDLVGRNPSAEITALGRRPGVNLIGHVKDVRPFVEQAAVYVVPLRIGGGTRLKILEALAMSKAVVSTGVGAEGLEITDGENIMLADTPELFAQKIAILLKDRELNLHLGRNGRKLVEDRYGWNQLAGRLEKAIAALVTEDT